MDNKFLHEIDCESFFDHLEDLIDFPSEHECNWNDTLPLDDRISIETAMPCLSWKPEDVLQLEWLSTLIEDSFDDGGLVITKDENSTNKEPSRNESHISSPISVLGSSSCSSSSSGGTTVPPSPSPRGTKRARSTRPRPRPRPCSPIQLISTPTLFGENPQPEMNQNPPAEAVRKCMHCEITKTPQWRLGPMGPKTLCNACGVRYKSGRLFPEYRPVASPTFVPSLHSNSHKRVLDMRMKSIKKDSTSLSVIQTPTRSVPELE